MALLHSCVLTLCAVAAAASNRTISPQRRQLRKTAGEHMDGVKAWVRQKANNDAPSLVAELKELRANAGECTFDPKHSCKHQNNGIPCAPLREGCKRPSRKGRLRETTFAASARSQFEDRPPVACGLKSVAEF